MTSKNGYLVILMLFSFMNRTFAMGGGLLKVFLQFA